MPKDALDVERLPHFTRDEFAAAFDSILEKVERGCDPILIRSAVTPDLLLMG